MIEMPDPQLQLKIQNLEKIESYLKQQLNELEDDRKELYDLLREDKKTIHELKVKLRAVELSEENLKIKLNQISDEETRLLEENDNLQSKVHELELSLTLLAKIPGLEKSTITDGLETENEKRLNSEMKELHRTIEELKERNQARDAPLSHSGLVNRRPDEEKMKNLQSSYCQTDAVEVREIKNTRSKNTPAMDGDESGMKSLQSKEVSAYGRANDADVMDETLGMMRRNKAAQTDDAGDDVEMLKRSLMMKEKELMALNEEMEELKQELNNKHAVLKKITNEAMEKDDVIQDKQRKEKMESQKFFMLFEASKQDKSTLENELSALKNLLLTKTADLEDTNLEKTTLTEKLKGTEMELARSEQSRVTLQDENAALIMNKLMEVASLKKNIADKDDEVKTLWTDMNKIQKNYTEYIEKSEKEKLILEDRVNELTKELNNKRNDLEIMTSELERTGEKLKIKEEEVRKLIEKENETLPELQSMRKNMMSREDEVKMLLNDLNNLQHKYATLVQEHEDCIKTETNLRRELDACKVDLKTSRDVNSDLTRKQQLKDAKMEFLEKSNLEWEERMKTSEAEVHEMKQKLQQIELQKEFISSSNEQRQKMVALTIMRDKTAKDAGDNLVTSQISHLKKIIESKDEEIKLLTEDINDMHKKVLELMQKSSDDPPSKMDEDVTSAVKDKNVERLMMELMRKREEVQTLMRNEKVLEDKYQRAAEEKSLQAIEHDSVRKTLASDLKNKNSAIEEKQKQLKSLAEQMTDLQTEHHDLIKNHDDLKIKLTQLNETLKVTGQQNKELLGQCKNLQAGLKEKEEAEKKLTDQFKELTRELNSAKLQLSVCTKERNILEDAVDKMRRQAAEMQNDLNDKQQLEVRVQQMMKTIQEKDKQIQALLERLNGCGEEIDSLLKERRELQHVESVFHLLRKEFDQLAAFSKKQSKELQTCVSKEQDLIHQIRDKDLQIDELNAELSRCSDLSRKLNILNISR